MDSLRLLPLAAVIAILLASNPLVSQPTEGRATIVARSRFAHVSPLKQVQPVYPARAKADGIQGLVRVNAIIDREGVPGHFKVLRGPRELIPATLEALKQWRYRPCVIEGKAVEVEASFDINFVIPKKAPAPSENKPLTFQPTLAAQIEDTNAARAGFSAHHFGSTCFKASNGATLTVMSGNFKDADEAKRFMDWHSGNAFKITSQETKTDMDGKPIEHRSELILGPEHSSIEVMWVVGKAARWIIAKDREDALELERYYRRSQAQSR